jgi:hypothetical protein
MDQDAGVNHVAALAANIELPVREASDAFYGSERNAAEAAYT